MSNLATGKDSLAGKLKGRLGWWLVGAAAALVVAGLSLGTASAQTGGATYTGDVAASGDCGGGTVSVTVSADGTEISSASVAGVGDGTGSTVSGSADFPATTAPIASDGSFTSDDVYIQGATGNAGIGGTFAGSNLAGDVTISGSTCGPLSFSAVAAAVAAPTALPSTGTGTSTDGSTGAPWPLIGAAIALLGLGAGTVLLRRRVG